MKYNSLVTYRGECAGSLFVLSNNPDLVNIDASTYYLIVAPPNQLAVVGEYLFFINNWLVNLKVTAPCNTKNLQGLDERGFLII